LAFQPEPESISYYILDSRVRGKDIAGGSCPKTGMRLSCFLDAHPRAGNRIKYFILLLLIKMNSLLAITKIS
jgi:hypothetical protein